MAKSSKFSSYGRSLAGVLFFSLFIFSGPLQGHDGLNLGSYGIVIHGGSSSATPQDHDPENTAARLAMISEALSAGHAILKEGGSSLDAVETAINILEDSPLFNAGRGAISNNEGVHELDSSIMEGADLNAGAVAGVQHIKNPISAARLVMEESPHVLLVGEGAERFARKHGHEPVSQEYFLREPVSKKTSYYEGESENMEPSERVFGTVGAVALDRAGNLAAGTSTGGYPGKMPGRVGDSPIIGAGTFADNRTCAVSATGHGEYFMRFLVAHDISAMMEYGGVSLNEAADEVIMKKLVKTGGSGGIIAIDRDGNVAMPYNTHSMYRGYAGSDGKVVTIIFKDD